MQVRWFFAATVAEKKKKKKGDNSPLRGENIDGLLLFWSFKIHFGKT